MGVNEINGIDNTAGEVKVGLPAYKLLIPQVLLEPGSPCTKQQRLSATFSNHGRPKTEELWVPMK